MAPRKLRSATLERRAESFWRVSFTVWLSLAKSLGSLSRSIAGVEQRRVSG
jgi:hypothetical protein